MAQIKVGIYGAAGYAGQNLVEILAMHPSVEIVFATSNTYTNEPVALTDLRYVASDDVDLAHIDVVFLALPHKASAPIAKIARTAGKKVIDLSADLRFDEAENYQKWYDVVHPHPEMLSDAPYGLPEMHRDKIVGSDIVGVPGCYPTATLLSLYPLLYMKGLSLDAPIIVDAKSGVSGAGRGTTATTHFINAYGDIIPYKVGRKHRHVGEIEQEINRYMPSTDQLIFTPHLVPIDRGLMASVYAALNYSITGDKVHALYNNIYVDEPLIEVLPPDTHATFKGVQRKNNAQISITPISERYVHITCTIDNLRKGAASQAVQCFNLMMGLSEIEGLL